MKTCGTCGHTPPSHDPCCLEYGRQLRREARYGEKRTSTWPRFLPCFAFAAWLPHCEGAARWLFLSAFVWSLVFLLKGMDA